jgi:hypothetical protein
MAAKKKTPSAANFRKAEESGKAKYKSGAARTDAKGNKGMGASKSNTQKPGFYTTGERTSSKLTDAHNSARALVVGNAISKAVIGAASSAIGKSIGKGVEPINFKHNVSANMKGMDATGAGGRLYSAQTPQGPALSSTRIGSAAQQGARMNNLSIPRVNAAMTASQGSSAEIAGKAIVGMNMAGKLVRQVAGATAASKLLENAIAPKKNKKK